VQNYFKSRQIRGILGKISENLHKIPEYLSKLSEYMSRSGPQLASIWKKWRPKS